MHVLTVFLGVLNVAAIVTAQSGPQAAKIPTCVLPCDTKAIATTTCTSADRLCHCQQSNLILNSISTCILTASNCTTPLQDLYTFEGLFAIVCDEYNMTIPTNTTSFPSISNSSTTASTALPNPTIPAFTNGAARAFGAPWLGLF